jgi:hypothetical protein
MLIALLLRRKLDEYLDALDPVLVLVPHSVGQILHEGKDIPKKS